MHHHQICKISQVSSAFIFYAINGTVVVFISWRSKALQKQLYERFYCSAGVQEGSSQVQYYGHTKSLGRSTFQGSSYSLQIPFPSRIIKKTRISYFISFQLKQHYRETAGVITQMHYLCSKSEKQSCSKSEKQSSLSI
ncbi:hypothetical protein WN943_006412 [Citrus x changshan-huyou]